MPRSLTNKLGQKKIYQTRSNTEIAFMVVMRTHGQTSHNSKVFKMNTRYWTILIKQITRLSKFTAINNMGNNQECSNS